MNEETKSYCLNAKTFIFQNKSTNHLFLLKQMIGLSIDSINLNVINQLNLFNRCTFSVLDKFKNCLKSNCFLKAKSNSLTSSSIKSNNCNLICTKNCLPCFNCYQYKNYTSLHNSDFIRENIPQINDYNDNLSSASRSSAIYINNLCKLNEQCSDYINSNKVNKMKRNQKLKNDFKICKDATNKKINMFNDLKIGLFKTFLLFSLFANLLTRINTKNHKLQQIIIPLLLILCTVFNLSDACSARSTPKPRPPLPEIRPNITFQTYQCPEAYANWYCLNGATCFFVRIGESILYNCECADGYMGQRCEFKDLEGSYMQSREKVLVETAKIAGGALSVFVVFIFVGLVFYANYINKRKSQTRFDNHINHSPFIT